MLAIETLCLKTIPSPGLSSPLAQATGSTDVDGAIYHVSGLSVPEAASDRSRDERDPTAATGLGTTASGSEARREVAAADFEEPLGAAAAACPASEASEVRPAQEVALTPPSASFAAADSEAPTLGAEPAPAILTAEVCAARRQQAAPEISWDRESLSSSAPSPSARARGATRRGAGPGRKVRSSSRRRPRRTPWTA